MSAELFVLVGLPGAGKTTYAKVLAALRGCSIVSTDEIRTGLGLGPESGRVFGPFYAEVARRLQAGERVIADSTALDGKVRSMLLLAAHGVDADAHAVVFEDATRYRAFTGRTMLENFRRTLRLIGREGFDSVYRVGRVDMDYENGDLVEWLEPGLEGVRWQVVGEPYLEDGVEVVEIQSGLEHATARTADLKLWIAP